MASHANLDSSALATSVSSEKSEVDIESTNENLRFDNEQDIARIISLDDDPSVNPCTFRSFLLGIGLVTFGSILGIIILLLWIVVCY